MTYDIILAPEAVADLRRLKAAVRAAVRHAMELHLGAEPTKVSKSRVKRLRGMSRPQYRLRVDDVRVFYDVIDNTVEVLAIVERATAYDWLRESGTTSTEGDDHEAK
jgi:mRNA-degrading endonuclease RelE of RelBE toxin-antitoxin system